jgi:hypothetical protein
MRQDERRALNEGPVVRGETDQRIIYYPECDDTSDEETYNQLVQVHPNGSFRERHWEGAKDLAANSLSKNTQKRYSTGWRHWLTFLGLWNEEGGEADKMNPLMKYTPNHIRVKFLTAFVHYLVRETNVRSEKGVSGILSAVRDRIRSEFGDVSAFSHQTLLACKAAVGRGYTLGAEGHRGTQRLPFTLDLLMDALRELGLHDNIQSRMLSTALLVAYMALLRIGEYVDSPPSRHSIKGRDVSIRFEPGCWWDLNYGAMPTNLAQIPVEAKITLRSRKTDQRGRGTVIPLVRNEDEPSLDVVGALARWMREANPGPNDPVFSFRAPPGNRLIKLARKDVTNALKHAATRMQVNPQGISTHSIRIGAATSLHAQGASDYVLRELGGWRSSTMPVHYSRTGRADVIRMQRMLTTTEAFTAADTRALCQNSIPAQGGGRSSDRPRRSASADPRLPHS